MFSNVLRNAQHYAGEDFEPEIRLMSASRNYRYRQLVDDDDECDEFDILGDLNNMNAEERERAYLSKRFHDHNINTSS